MNSPGTETTAVDTGESTDPIPVSISILDKEYLVSCPPGDKKALIESARILNERLSSMREGGKVLGAERMAVMTALNVIHEHNQLKHESDQFRDQIHRRLRSMQEKVQSVISRRHQVERLD